MTTMTPSLMRCALAPYNAGPSGPSGLCLALLLLNFGTFALPARAQDEGRHKKELIWNECWNGVGPCKMTVNKGDIVIFKMVNSQYQHSVYKMPDEGAHHACDFSGATKLVDGLVTMEGMTFNGVMTMEGHEVAMDVVGTFYYACSSACGLTVDGTVTADGREFPGAYTPGSPGPDYVCDVCHCSGGHHKVAITVVEGGSAPVLEEAVVYPDKMQGPKCWTPGAKELIWNRCFMGEEPCEMTVNAGDTVSFKLVDNMWQHSIYQIPDEASYDGCDYAKAEKVLDRLMEMPGAPGMITNGLTTFMMGHELKMSAPGTYYYICASMCGMVVDGTETIPGQKMPSEQVPGAPAGMTCDVCHCSGFNHKVKITVVESGAPEVPITYPRQGTPSCVPNNEVAASPAPTPASPASPAPPPTKAPSGAEEEENSDASAAISLRALTGFFAAVGVAVLAVFA